MSLNGFFLLDTHVCKPWTLLNHLSPGLALSKSILCWIWISGLWVGPRMGSQDLKVPTIVEWALTKYTRETLLRLTTELVSMLELMFPAPMLKLCLLK